MRTIYPVMLVVAIGVASLIWGMSGVGAIYGQDDPVDGLDSGQAVENASNDSAVSGDGNGSYTGEASSTAGEGDIIGLIVSGIGDIVGFASMVPLLPWELMQLGFPAYFSFPIGFLTQAIVGIGIIQFATNRDFK